MSYSKTPHWKIFTLILFWILCPFISTHLAKADIISYPDMQGDNVHFQDMVESSQEQGAMYGEPNVSGNEISFPATGFVVQAVNNQVDFVNGRLDMTIQAKPGFMIESLTFEEVGTFFLQGPDATVNSSSVSVITANGTNHFGDMSFETSSPGNGAWSNDMTVFFDPTGEVQLVYDSRLLAATGNGSVAFIDKSMINISVGFVSAVPEPTTGLLAGLALITAIRRRIRRH